MKKRILKLLSFLIIVLVLAGTSYYFYSRFTKAQYLLNNPDAASKEESDAIIARVSKLILLPKGETPQIATIIDASKLKNQPFFSNAENNDKVLVYTKAQEAIIFRPHANMIVANVGPLYIGVPTPLPAQAGIPSPSRTPRAALIKVAIYNGTNTTGLANTAQTELTSKFVGLQVVSKTDAANKNYTTSLVIDLTGNNKDIATIIAKDLNATVTTLPTGETALTNTDLLIILGSNYGK